MKYPLKAYSWTVESPDIAFKRMDKSSFLHRGTGIPKQIIDFFKIPKTKLLSSLNIFLWFEGKQFDAHIEMDTLHLRYRLFWLSDFTQEIKNRFPDQFEVLNSGRNLEDNSFPTMRFGRIDDNNFSVSWESFGSKMAVIEKTSEDWSDEELQAAVLAYFGMLNKELSDEEYNKAEVNRQLREDVLAGRSKQSIEFRMANISSVLIDLCHPTINGYKPRGNVGSEVGNRIKSIINEEKLLVLDDYFPSDDKSKLDLKVSKILDRGIVGKPKGQMVPSRSQSSSTSFVRDPLVKAWVIDNAKGQCELCNDLGPFIDSKTNYNFLEEHHVIPLSENGPDTIENAVALCPNCHRKCHLSCETQDIRTQLQEKISRISQTII